MPRAPEWRHLGDLGPVLHAEVGDTIEVMFQNNTPFPAGGRPAHAALARERRDSAGKWLFQCHVAAHITAGTQATYTVLP